LTAKAEKKQLQEATIYGHRKVIETLRGARHGKRYKVPGMKHKYYTASKPGEPPAAPTGRMRSSVKWQLKGGSFLMTGEVGTPLDYPLILEDPKNERAWKYRRKWLSIGMKKAEPEIKRILKSRWFR